MFIAIKSLMLQCDYQLEYEGINPVPNTKQPVKKPKTKAKRGRPTKFSPELALKICDLLSDGISLRKVCEREDMPNKITVLRWLRDDDEFCAQYTRAKEDSADSLADDIQDLADDVLSGRYDPQAARVAGDLKKWSASKLKPKKYGEKIDLTSGGEKLPTPLLGGLSAQHDKLTKEIDDEPVIEDAKEYLEEQDAES